MKSIIIFITIVALNYIICQIRCTMEAKRAFERYNKKKIKLKEVR
ncbi:MAG: hypothetical protein ACLRZT_01945 [Clostridium paraputrificum]|nr:MAG TPA_asm: hypothetical protein [Caudoviricetes sp.]